MGISQSTRRRTKNPAAAPRTSIHRSEALEVPNEVFEVGVDTEQPPSPPLPSSRVFVASSVVVSAASVVVSSSAAVLVVAADAGMEVGLLAEDAAAEVAVSGRLELGAVVVPLPLVEPSEPVPSSPPFVSMVVSVAAAVVVAVLVSLALLSPEVVSPLVSPSGAVRVMSMQV